MSQTKTCFHCGGLFSRNKRLSHLQWACALYCSLKCSAQASAAKKRDALPPLKDRFTERFVKVDGCWNWTGTIDGYGYGVIDHCKHRYRAHVLALQYDGIEIPDGHLVRHKCDNPRCVNPAHLETGTPKDNAQDAVSRGRNSKGEGHGFSKLTDSAVRQIRSATGSHTEIGKAFNVSRTTIARIKRGITWAHVK